MPLPGAQFPISPTPLAIGVNLCVQDVIGPASYTTGGVKVYANTFGMLSLRYINAMGTTRSTTYYVREVSPSGPGSSFVTLKWFVSATNAEVANATNLSAEFIRVLAVGA